MWACIFAPHSSIISFIKRRLSLAIFQRLLGEAENKIHVRHEASLANPPNGGQRLFCRVTPPELFQQGIAAGLGAQDDGSVLAVLFY